MEDWAYIAILALSFVIIGTGIAFLVAILDEAKK